MKENMMKLTIASLIALILIFGVNVQAQDDAVIPPDVIKDDAPVKESPPSSGNTLQVIDPDTYDTYFKAKNLQLGYLFRAHKSAASVAIPIPALRIKSSADGYNAASLGLMVGMAGATQGQNESGSAFTGFGVGFLNDQLWADLVFTTDGESMGGIHTNLPFKLIACIYKKMTN